VLSQGWDSPTDGRRFALPAHSIFSTAIGCNLVRIGAGSGIKPLISADKR
jgi:hypothetical protein